MSFTRTAVAALMIGSLAMSACSDDDEDPTGPEVSQFAGAWTATNIRYTSQSTPSRTLDATQVGGALTMQITAAGSFSGSITIPGVGTLPLSGQITLEGDNEAEVDFQPDSPAIDDFTATYTLNGNTVVFTNPDASFQFPGQAAAEASVVVITMVRAS